MGLVLIVEYEHAEEKEPLLCRSFCRNLPRSRYRSDDDDFSGVSPAMVSMFDVKLPYASNNPVGNGIYAASYCYFTDDLHCR